VSQQIGRQPVTKPSPKQNACVRVEQSGLDDVDLSRQ